MNSRPVYLVTLRDIYFLTVCAGIFVFMVTCALWIYANFFAFREKPRRLAADGVFYLRTYASTRTDHGVVGFSAGERVERVNSGAAPGMVRVTDGRYAFDVAPSDLTDDLDLAEALGATDFETQRQLGARASADQVALQDRQGQINQNHASDVARISSVYKNASVVGTLVSPLNNASSRGWGSSSSYYGPYYSGGNTVVVTGRGLATASTAAPRAPAPTRTYSTEDPNTRLREAARSPSPGYGTFR